MSQESPSIEGTIVTLKRRRRIYPLDPCLGFYPESAPRLNPQTIRPLSDKVLQEDSPLLFNIPKDPQPLCVSDLSPSHDIVDSDRQVSSSIMKSRPSPPMVTVETFLRNSAAKLSKKYRIRGCLQSKGKYATMTTSNREEEHYQNSGVELNAPILPAQVKRRSRTALKSLHPQVSARQTTGRSSATMRSTSRLATAGLAHPDVIFEAHQLPYNLEEVESRPPLDLGPVLDLDFPLLQRHQKSKKWKQIKPHLISFPRPSPSLLKHSSSTTGETVSFRPITHWRTNEPFRTNQPSTVVSKNRNVISSRQGILPLQFVSWKEHEESLSELKACRLGSLGCQTRDSTKPTKDKDQFECDWKPLQIADTQAQVYVSWNNRLVTSSSESLESAIDGDDNRKTLSFHSANYRNVHVMDVDGAVTHTEVLPISMSPHRLPSDTSTPPRHLLAKVEAEDKTFLNLSCDPLESLVISLSYTDLPVHQLHTDRRTIPIESLGSRSNCTD